MEGPGVAPVRARRISRFAWFLLPAFVFVVLLGAGLARNPGPPGPGDAAPAFEAKVLDGPGTLALSGLRGKPVVLNFWASWCVPCKDEAPLLRAASARFGDQVAFVGVDVRDAASDARAFIERYKIDYPSVRDEGLAIYSDYGLTGQPETFFIDADGNIVEHVPGPLFPDDLDRLIRGLLQGPS